jgi:hypothetical protein
LASNTSQIVPAGRLAPARVSHVARLDRLTRDISENVVELARFDAAAVVQRPGGN